MSSREQTSRQRASRRGSSRQRTPRRRARSISAEDEQGGVGSAFQRRRVRRRQFVETLDPQTATPRLLPSGFDGNYNYNPPRWANLTGIGTLRPYHVEEINNPNSLRNANPESNKLVEEERRALLPFTNQFLRQIPLAINSIVSGPLHQRREYSGRTTPRMFYPPNTESRASNLGALRAAEDAAQIRRAQRSQNKDDGTGLDDVRPALQQRPPGWFPFR